MYFDKTASIQRLQALLGNSNKEEYSEVEAMQNLQVNVQPASSETVAITGGIFGKTYSVYTTQSGIKDGDRLTVSGLFGDGLTLNKQLDVKDVGDWSFGPLPHFEIICTEFE